MSAKKQWTTPQKIVMMQSIKKSIHRSIEKINPTQYKNILKGQNIYMHISYQGQTINTEYTKVALFMGAIVYKKAYQKITVIVTNEINNKAVKKLIGMGKLAVSVLWLEACFQQKRKVPYQDFLFEQEKIDNGFEQGQQEDVHETFDNFLQKFQKKSQNFRQILEQQSKKPNILRYIQKKQRISEQYRKYLIFPQEIDLGAGNKRRSEIISEKPHKKKNKKNLQIKSEVLDKKQQSKYSGRDSDDQYNFSEIENQSQNKDYVEEHRNSTDLIYKKYLKDFKQYQSNYDTKISNQFQQKISQNQTPFFTITQTKQQTSIGQNSNYDQNHNIINTPTKTTSLNQPFTKTCSVKKKSHNYNYTFFCINSNLLKNIEIINENRSVNSIEIVYFDNSITKKAIVLASPTSKVDILRAKIQDPKMIISQKFIHFLQKDHLCEISYELLKKFEIKFKLNTHQIHDKKVVLLDSVIGVEFLQSLMRYFGAKIIKLGDFLFDSKVDYVVSNRKTFIRTNKQTYQVYTQGKFIDLLIQFFQ